MLFCGFAVNFDFNVVVLFISAIAIAIEVDITSLDTLGIYKFALIGLNVMHVFADAKTGRVVDIIIEQDSCIRDTIRIIGNLYYYIVISPVPPMVVPYYNSI